MCSARAVAAVGTAEAGHCPSLASSASPALILPRVEVDAHTARGHRRCSGMRRCHLRPARSRAHGGGPHSKLRTWSCLTWRTTCATWTAPSQGEAHCAARPLNAMRPILPRAVPTPRVPAPRRCLARPRQRASVPLHSYAAMVRETLASFSRHLRRHARLVMRTSNVGHPECHAARRPLPRRADAWDALGGWGWTPLRSTPAYFGQPRPDSPDRCDAGIDAAPRDAAPRGPTAASHRPTSGRRAQVRLARARSARAPLGAGGSAVSARQPFRRAQRVAR